MKTKLLIVACIIHALTGCRAKKEVNIAESRSDFAIVESCSSVHSVAKSGDSTETFIEQPFIEFFLSDSNRVALSARSITRRNKHTNLETSVLKCVSKDSIAHAQLGSSVSCSETSTPHSLNLCLIMLTLFVAGGIILLSRLKKIL